eukprot:jgi/Tetstr1/440255/TSEL_028606.t1
MAKVWAPFFECAHISENPSNTKDRLEVVYPHLHGKLTRFPIEFFPLATNSTCFSVGNLPQTVRHFGFSDTAANKIALTLDMPAPTPLTERLVAPHLVGESPPITDPTVATFVGNQDFLQTRVRSFFGSQDLCDRVADLGDRLVAARFAGSLGEEKAWTFIGGGRKQLHLDMSVAAASSLGVVPWLEQNRTEVLAELRKVRNLYTGRLAQSKSLVPLGVADDRYRMNVCDGNEDVATYSRPGLAFLLAAQDVHASPPKGGVNPAFATRCPRCKEVAGVSPCFRIFLSLHSNTCAMMLGPEWRILPYHVPGLAAFLPEVDHKDEAYCRMHETAKTMAAAKGMRHWSPEAHIGDDDYILEDVKASGG